jgi:23S rRNA (adenine2503-C2)-methyltransferase
MLTVDRREVGRCGTTKLELGLADGKAIETVVIPSERRTTVCVSTQVGCARGCIFCVTATMGLARGLSPGEIVGQVTAAIREARAAGMPPVRNVVYMGMGEPLDHLEAVAKSISVLCSPRALGLGPAHVTLSTIGTTPDAILATRDLRVQMAWSLHAVDDALRRRLIPTARHSVAELRDAFIERGSSLFVEVALMERVNDEGHHADAMAAFLEPLTGPVRVNLLPLNPGREGLEPSSPARAVAFRQRLRERGYFCAIRRPRGLDARAACGQLVAP